MTVSFAASVWPILSSDDAHCNACHDSESPASGVDLGSSDAAYTTLTEGYISGDAESAYLIKKMRGDDEIYGDPMPPPPYDLVSASDLEIIKDWITTGANP